MPQRLSQGSCEMDGDRAKDRAKAMIQKESKKMEDVVENLGYDITLPMVDHSLSSATVAGRAAIKLNKDIEQLSMIESTMETAKACVETQRLLFIFVSTLRGRMNVELVLAADTLHHMPLNEQVLAILSNIELREDVVIGQWVSSYKLIVSVPSDVSNREIYCEEGTVEPNCEKIGINLNMILSSINRTFAQKNTDIKENTEKSRLSIKLLLTMKNQEHGISVYKRSIHMDPAMLSCFNQLTPLVASSAHYHAGEGSGIKEFLFVDTHIHSKENILSTISTHLRTGFRPCPLTNDLNLPTKPSDRYKSYKDCLEIYSLLEGRGLLKSCVNVDNNSDADMTLCINIPSRTLTSQTMDSDPAHIDDCECQLSTDTTADITIQASYIPVVLPCMPTISQYLDKFDPSGQWRDMQPEKIRIKLLQKQSLLQSAQQRLKQSEILEQIGSPGGFERALQRLTDSSDLLGGMQYLMKPGAEHRLDETYDLETLSQQVIQTAGPEFVRDSVGSALLGRYKQDSLL